MFLLRRLTHVASLLGFILLIAAIIGLEFYRDLDTSLSPNPNPKVVNFQNAGNSFLTVFTVVTLEGWSGIMYAVSSSSSLLFFLFSSFHPLLFLFFFCFFWGVMPVCAR